MSLVSTEKKEKNVVILEIAVGAEALEEAAQKAFRRQVKNITIPGFRKGKAPRTVIEKMYGEDMFLQDAVDALYPGAYEEAVKEAGIDPVDRAEVEMVSLDKATGFTFKATVTVKPEVTIGKYKMLTAKRPFVKVTDEQVDAELDKIRERNARILTVEDDRPAKDGDITVIDFEGFVDGVAFDGGKGEGFQLALGSGQFIQGFEEQIVGHKIGEEFEVNVTFPEEYHSADLQGKAAVFKVKLNELKEKELPALDDEFAKDASEFDTLDAMKDDMRTKMQEAIDKREQDDVEGQLIDQVIETMEADIPECMNESKIDEMVRDFAQRLQSQGMEMETYFQYSGMEPEKFRDTFRAQAERQVKIRLCLEKIAEMENIQLSDEEFEAELQKMADNYKIDIERIRHAVPKEEMQADVCCTRALDLIVENAKIVEQKAEEAEDEAKKGKKTQKAESKEDGEPEEKKKTTRKRTTKKKEADTAEAK